NKIFLLLFLPILWMENASTSPVKDTKITRAGKRTSACYFVLPRYSSMEKGKRLPQSKSRAKCSEELIDLAPLSDIKKGDLKRNSKTKEVQCGFPEKGHTTKAKSRVTYQKSKAFLEENKVLLLTGLPICSRHAAQLNDMAEKIEPTSPPDSEEDMDIDEEPIDEEMHEEKGPDGEEDESCIESEEEDDDDDDNGDLYDPTDADNAK
ncbi:hypothetical protein PFISCL1PPCAC_12979, partial [Pristionchus fissidentatus]